MSGNSPVRTCLTVLAVAGLFCGLTAATAVSAVDFLNSIGINSAVSRRGETLGKTIECAGYLGIRWFRSGYSIAGRPATVHDLLLQKSDGTFALAVWNERVSGSDNVTVDLGATYPAVRIYDPTVGTAAARTLTNVSTVTLSLSDHPNIIEIAAPATGAASARGARAGAAASGPQVLLTNGAGVRWRDGRRPLPRPYDTQGRLAAAPGR